MIQLFGSPTVPYAFQGGIWYNGTGLSCSGGPNGQCYEYQWGELARSGQAVVIGQWYHIVFTYDRRLPEMNARMYVNGALASYVQSFTNPIIIAPTTGITLGNRADLGNQRGLDGQISKARVFNYALTPQEVTQRYAEGR